MQEYLNEDSGYQKYNLKVDNVLVFKNSEYDYKGCAKIIYKGSSHFVIVEISVNDDAFMWRAPPGEFMFVAQ